MKLSEDLRRSILQAAIQGKLTQQLETDGTAEDLLKKIRAEKANLLAEGKLKKEKPLPPITDNEKPFEIPENWVWVRLQTICSKIVDGDHTPPAGLRNKTEYIMLSALNVNNNSLINLDKARYLSKETFDCEQKRINLTVDDILLTIVGTLGRSCVYKGEMNICFQRSVAILTTMISPYFLKCVLDAPNVQQYMVKKSTGTAQKGFYLNQVAELLIPLPPLAEQKRIVERVETIMSKLDELEKAENELETLKKKFPDDMRDSLLQAAIQGKLTEQKSEDGTAEDLLKKIRAEKENLTAEGKLKKREAITTDY